MASVFDSYRRLYDIDRLQEQTVLVVGGGRIGFKAVRHLAQAGIWKIIVVDSDLVNVPNVGYGYPFSSVGRAKVTGLGQMLKEINPDIVYVPVRRRVRLRNLAFFEQFIDQSSCVVILIDSFGVAAALAGYAYSRVPCVAAVELAGVEVGDVAWSWPYATPCLDCTMHLRRRVAGHGGQALPDAIDLLATITTKFVMALCLREPGGREHKGYEHYGHFLDPARCRGFVYNGPNDFMSQARDDFPCFFQLLGVVTDEHRPGCSVCQGYSSQTF